MKKSFKYDAFISYKRKGGTPWAELLFWALDKIAKKRVFIDRYGLIAGNDWEESINRAIEDSINVVVIIFPGIQDVIKDKDDCFIKEITKALDEKNKKGLKIIPFYVEGLSSKVIQTDILYEGIPEALKTITAPNYQDLIFNPEFPDEWSKRLFNALKPEEEILKEILKESCYEVRVNALCKMSVYDEDASSEDNNRKRKLKGNGDYTTFWVGKSDDVLILRFSDADNKYKVTINTSQAPIEDSWVKDYEARFYTRRPHSYNDMCRIKDDGVIVVTLEWNYIKLLREEKKDIMLRPYIGDIVNSYKDIIEHE